MSKGLSGVKTLTAKEIANKWKLPLAVVAKKIAAGAKVEKEHTTSSKQANEIARDHLGERPDYYEKLDKMEKAPIVKEEIGTDGVRGLGFVTGDPGVNYVDQYINTNAMSYEDWNGNILKMIKDKHNKHLKDMGFSSYSPNELQNSSNKVVKESLLNELGEYDNKGGTVGATGLTDPAPRIYRKNEMAENDLKGVCWKGYTAKGLKKKGNRMVPNCVPVKEQSPANRSYTERPMYEKSSNAYPIATDRGIYQEGHIGFGHPYDWAGDRVKRKFYGTKPKEKPESNEPGTSDTYKDSKQGGKVKFAKTVKEATYQGRTVPLNKPMKGDVKKSKVYVDPDGDGVAKKVNFGDKHLSIKKDQPERKKSYCARSSGQGNLTDKSSANYWSRKAWNCEESVNEGRILRSLKDKDHEPQPTPAYAKKIEQEKHDKQRKKINRANAVHMKMYMRTGDKKWLDGMKEETISELKAETLGSYIKKAAVSRKAALNKGGAKADVKTWGKRQQGIKTAINKLTAEDANRPDRDLEARSYSGATGITHTIHEETKMENQNPLINEALDNILEDNLSEMKENLMLALQEKAMEKLEERKKEIAALYFAQ